VTKLTTPLLWGHNRSQTTKRDPKRSFQTRWKWSKSTTVVTSVNIGHLCFFQSDLQLGLTLAVFFVWKSGVVSIDKFYFGMFQ
jgi:hypothetical protein